LQYSNQSAHSYYIESDKKQTHKVRPSKVSAS